MKPVYTNAQVISQIDSGNLWTSGGATATTITYGITTNKTWFPSNYAEYSGWSAFNAKQSAAAVAAIQLWDDLIAPSFTAAADPNTADIRFSNSSTGVSYAHAYNPGEVNTDTYSWQKVEGSVWLNSGNANLLDPDPGEYASMAIAHEIGHTLGLDHPGNYNGGSPTYANDAVYEQDTHMYTIMSYFDSENTGADWWTDNWVWIYPQTPMLHDVLVIQSMYGADMTTRAGNTTYGFNSTAGNSVFDFSTNANPVLTIWDGGGEDTIDLSGWSTSSRLTLEEGTYSDVNSMVYNLAIAYGAEIENAIGGSGNDNITGNGLANKLIGNNGADTLNGGDGNDWLDGGAGADILIGGAGNDTFIFDFADDASQYDAGTGTDLLIVNGDTLPTLDLAALGFEAADLVRVDDAATQAWQSITTHYNAAWQAVTQDMIFDDGVTRETVWDLAGSQSWDHQETYTDVPDTQGYSSMVQSFNPSGALYDRVYTYDDGLIQHTEFDVDSAQPWNTRVTYTDAASTQQFSSYTQLINAGGQVYDRNYIFDSGLEQRDQWDVDNAQAWSRITTFTDASALYGFDNYDIYYDDLGRLYDRVYTYDGGLVQHTEWDVAGTQSWATRISYTDAGSQYTYTDYTQLFNDAGQLYDQQLTFDSGLAQHTVWDLAGTQSWHRQVTLTDAADDYSWATQTLDFDAGGVLVNVTVVEDLA